MDKILKNTDNSVILYFDGGSRGNPGIAAGAAVIILAEGKSLTMTRYMEIATNNEAEYTGLIIGLEKAQELGLKSLEIRGDSQLIINQVKGDWKVKSESLRPFYQRACQLVARFDRISWRWIERAKNSLADAAANQCMDAGKKSPEKPDQGETNLDILLKSLKPTLNTGEFVFCSLKPARLEQLQLTSICQFQEQEGITVIITRQQADQVNLQYNCSYGQITLSVHSSLEAVGFLAVISHKLAGAGISVNVISGYYHDHLFVPTEKVTEAMAILREISR
jgi:ribonuclease HI